jgi:hypothetical protein
VFTERIDAVHDFRHPADDDPNYNESTYYNFASRGNGVIGWLRIAVQPNRAASQATALVFLPSGEIAFSHFVGGAVPEADLSVGPVSVDIIEPLLRQRVTFGGSVSILSGGRVTADLGSALRSASQVPASVTLTVTAAGAAFGTTGTAAADAIEASMARGHYEQFCSVTGDVIVDERRYRIEGRGLRDHSWGPRDWSGPLFYRWIVASLDDGSAIVALDVRGRDGLSTRRAALSEGGRSSEAELHDVTAVLTEQGYCREVVCRVRVGNGDLELRGALRETGQFVPLRHRTRAADGTESLTRIAYAPYDFITDDGRRGVGLVEALDQMIDERPAGMSASEAGRIRGADLNQPNG